MRGRPLTSDGGAFCKGNRERQVNATGEGPRGQEPPLSLCRAVRLQPAPEGSRLGLWDFGAGASCRRPPKVWVRPQGDCASSLK